MGMGGYVRSYVGLCAVADGEGVLGIGDGEGLAGEGYGSWVGILLGKAGERPAG